MSANSYWKGLFLHARRFLYGGVKAPAVMRMCNASTLIGNRNYESMDHDNRWITEEAPIRKRIVWKLIRVGDIY